MKRIILLFMLLIFSVGCVKKETTLKNEIVISEDAVAILSLVTYDGKDETKYGLMNLGHAFLTLENKSSEVITIYGFDVAPTEEITFSAWNTSLHAGVWFNIESAYIHEYQRYINRYSLSYGLTLEDIEKMNIFIEENDLWTPRKNCSYFSFNLWNEIVGEEAHLSSGMVITPTSLKEEIMLFEGYVIEKPIPHNEKMGYFKKSEFREYRMEG